MPRKLTIEEFKERANNIHGGVYDYSLVDYVNGDTKIEIICKEHGSFWQMPRSHLVGRGCFECGRMTVGIKIANLANETKLKFDEQYFSKIDTTDKAYYFGFICADGTHNKYQFKIKIRTKDRDVLDNFKKSIRSEHNIYEYGEDVTFRICSKLICEQLDALGCPSNKSLILQYPNIDKIYNKDFIRGVFDGDGCISGGIWSIVSGSEKFMYKIKNIIEEEVGITAHIHATKKNSRKNTIYCIYLSKLEDLALLYNYLYHEDCPCLLRKRDAILKRVEHYNDLLNIKAELDALEENIKNDKLLGLSIKEVAEKYKISLVKAGNYYYFRSNNVPRSNMRGLRKKSK